MLLPEAYVRHVLEAYNASAPEFATEAMLCVTGLLLLADADSLPMRSEDILGRRLWIPSDLSRNPNQTAAELESRLGEDVIRSFRTQMDSDALQSSFHIKPGERAKAADGYEVYYTRVTSSDHLSGLRVRWTLPDATSPTLVVDGDSQKAYEI